MHVVLMASVLIFSSIAGCLANEATDEENDVEKATIVVSTYHVEQLVSAIAGDSLNVEILAPSNVPVHDYEPSATDLVRLQGADMFFYHGLGLETWIDATLDSLGDDAPLSFATHAMPGEESALDYEGMLLTEICELLAEGPYEANELESVDYHADDLELHAEPVAHTLSYAVHDHGHDDHDDDHDDHVTTMMTMATIMLTIMMTTVTTMMVTTVMTMMTTQAMAIMETMMTTTTSTLTLRQWRQRQTSKDVQQTLSSAFTNSKRANMSLNSRPRITTYPVSTWSL